MVFVAHKIGFHNVGVAQLGNQLGHLAGILLGIEGGILVGFHGLAVVDGHQHDGFVGLLHREFHHRGEQQESDQGHGQTAQRRHRDAHRLLKDDVVVLVVEIQGVANAQQEGENDKPKGILCQQFHTN